VVKRLGARMYFAQCPSVCFSESKTFKVDASKR